MTATDLVLTVTQMLRKKGVVGKFVEFYGPGLDAMSAGRPCHDLKHGAGVRRNLRLLPQSTMKTMRYYLKMTGRADDRRIALVEEYAKAQGMFRTR